MIVTVTLNPSLDEWIELPAVRFGALNRASHFARYPGGKGINVSRVIHELGGHTQALAFAGGEDGLILREMMNRLGIRHEFVDIEGPTRNNYKIRTQHPPAFTEINTAGPRVSAMNLRALERRLLRRRPRPACAVFSGSLPPGAPPTIYHRWVSALQRSSVPCVLDTSGKALAEGLRARPWLVKPNQGELQELLGRRLRDNAAMVRAVRKLVREGPRVVILSLGRDGALMASSAQNGVWHAKAPAVKTVAAVGAGDSLVGGFVLGWAQGRPLVDALRLGVACGAATAMAPGTQLCHRHDVQRLLSRVMVRQVD